MILSRNKILASHISREFTINFLVAFIFFFLIFFINQILLLVQRVSLNNLSFITILILVSCAIPQILIYTVPFSTLSASSMVLGDLNANNELLALKSVGISIKKVYSILILISLLMSALTFFIADYLQPKSTELYASELARIMEKAPTFELNSTTINTIGDIILSSNSTSGNTIEEIVLFTRNSSDQDYSITAETGEIILINPLDFTYRMDLTNTNLLFSENNINNWGITAAKGASLFVNFSDAIPSLSNSSTTLTSKQLYAEIENSKKTFENTKKTFINREEQHRLDLSKLISNYSGNYEDAKKKQENYMNEINSGRKVSIPLFLQYYRAEFYKKFALALSCFALVILSLPLSVIKFKYGRLTGFGISLFMAVAYWFMLFFAQMQIYSFYMNSGVWMFLPNILVFIVGIIIIRMKRRQI